MAKVKKANKKPAKKTVSKKTAKSKSRTVKKKPVVKKNKPTNARKSIKKKTTIKKKVKKAAPQRAKTKANLKKIVKTVKKAKKAAVNKVKAVVKKVIKKIAKVKVVKTVNKKVEQLKNKKNPIVASSIAGSKKPVLVKGKLLVQTGKPRIDQEEKLHSKAQRIMKELEETMDMDKVKPRIKVPTFIPPKPKPAPVVKLPEPTNTKKEKYQLEFEFRSSKAILFSYLSDSSGMAGWFADEVRSSDHNYTFVWENTEVHAKLVAVKENQLVRFQWTDENDGTYFQFEIKEDDITSDIALLVTDWANPGEKEANARLWESQVQNLRQLIGSV